MTRHCLDLFSGLGGFSAAFQDHPDWVVTTVDIQEKFNPDVLGDVLNLRPSDLPGADVVLASPECKDFSKACAPQKWEHDEQTRPRNLPKNEEIPESIRLVYRTLWLIQELSPRWWFLENPQAMLRTILGEPVGAVHYCQYGGEFKKPTDLWGRHPESLTYRKCRGEVDCHVTNKREENKFRDQTRALADDGDYGAERAVVPYELSEAILQAVEDPGQEQSRLNQVMEA